MKKIVIFGTDVMAEYVYASLTDDINFKNQIVAFTVDREHMEETEKFGLPVVSFEEIEKVYLPEEHWMMVAMGYTDMNIIRSEKCDLAKEKGYKLYTHICSGSKLPSSVKVGENCFVSDGVSLQPFISIGNNTFIFGGAAIGHHTSIGSNCWITAGAVIGGNAKIGNNVFMGLNSTIVDGVVIGPDNFIGAGALIARCTGDGEAYLSVPAVKHRLNSKQFLAFTKCRG